MRISKNGTPLEETEQVQLFRWAGYMALTVPELRLLHAIPNGGERNKIVAAKLKAQGVKTGVSDVFLPVARCGRHGLYIEMKRQKGGRASEEQLQWIADVQEQGYAAFVCKGWMEAAQRISDYLGVNPGF